MIRFASGYYFPGTSRSFCYNNLHLHAEKRKVSAKVLPSNGSKNEKEQKDDFSITSVRQENGIKSSNIGYLSGVVLSLWNSSNWLSDVKKPRIINSSSTPNVAVHKINRSEVVKKTVFLVKKFLSADSVDEKLFRIDLLNHHLMYFPASRMVAVQNSTILPRLLCILRSSENDNLRAKSRQCLTLCGYVEPPYSNGVRILSIDGGGTRGMMGLEVLSELEKHAGGKKISELFDLIVGVSTGAIISTLLGAMKMQVSDAKLAYMEISRKLFDQGKFSGVSGLLLSHSYYNTTKWVQILKEMLGEEFSLIETSQKDDCPKLAILSCIVNAVQLQPFVFRNYEYPSGSDSHYRGSTQYKVWEAIQASAAAPGYFAEVLLGKVLHQDGGVLVNNPTSIALHESRLLWPYERLQAVVSVGNGQSIAEVELNSSSTSTWVHEKLSKIVDSATDTELVHNCVSDLLPANVYFRFNPYMSLPYTLDEIRPEKLTQMERDAKLYTRRNKRKIEMAAAQLIKSEGILHSMKRNFSQILHRKTFYF